MLKLLALVYVFGTGQTILYDIGVTFEGFLPVFGGRQGNVEVKMGVEAVGQAADSDGNAQVSSEVKTAEVMMNGAKMPLGIENIRTYFPKTTISLTPQGKMLKTDAPDLQMGFRLPGLDVKRFPDITYLPLEFPVEGIAEGKPFTFKKPFGDSDVTYEVTPTKIGDGTVSFSIKISQKYQTFENEKLQLVEEKDAISKVVTDMKGQGTATFDRTTNLVSQFDVSADAVSNVYNVKNKTETERKLKTRLAVKVVRL